MDQPVFRSVLSVFNVLFFLSASALSAGPMPAHSKNKEVSVSLDSAGIDTDKDGLTDAYEEKIGTELFLSDTDGDGLNDGLEVGENLDAPLNHDNDKRIDALDLDDDNDGLPTILELQLGADLDTDGDGIKNYLDKDSDNDGVSDGLEAGMLSLDANFDRIDDAFDAQLKVEGQESVEDKNGDGIADNISMPDYDNDGVVDMLDKDYQYTKNKGDKSPVGLADKNSASQESNKTAKKALKVKRLAEEKTVAKPKRESIAKVTPKVELKPKAKSESKTVLKSKASNPVLSAKKEILSKQIDSDNDGLLDSQEIAFGTNPKKRDSDNDKVSDAIEIGIDPKVAQDSDHDGKIDALDSDDDNDGILTRNEDINKDGSPINDDTDEDGVPNYLDANDDGDSLLTIAEGGTLDSDKDGILDYLDKNDAIKYKRVQEVVVLHDSNQTDFDNNLLNENTIENKPETTDNSQPDDRVTQALEQAIAHNRTHNKVQIDTDIDNSPEGKLAKKKQVPLRKTEKGFIPWLTSLLPN